MKIDKTIHNHLEDFLKRPTKINLKKLLDNNFGENNNLDFKSEWIDFDKIAKHIIAIANSGGGCILFGVKEKKNKAGYLSEGLLQFEEKAVIASHLSKYLPELLKYEVHDIDLTSDRSRNSKGKLFQIILIEDKPELLPFVSKKRGSNIEGETIYTRRNTASERANFHEIQEIINRRIATGHSTIRNITLNEHLEELELLYSKIPKFNFQLGSFGKLGETIHTALGGKENPDYPKESFQDFILKLTEDKKSIIRNFILKI